MFQIEKSWKKILYFVKTGGEKEEHFVKMWSKGIQKLYNDGAKNY